MKVSNSSILVHGSYFWVILCSCRLSYYFVHGDTTTSDIFDSDEVSKHSGGLRRRLLSLSSSQQQQQHRKLIDFIQEAQQAEVDQQLTTLENNGDASQVEIVDNVEDEVIETQEMNEDATIIQETFANEEPELEAASLVTNRRRFVRYEPSEWETQWIGQIDDIIQAQSFCRSLLGSDSQKEKLHDYLNAICGSRSEEPEMFKWCYLEDTNHYVWYNTDNRDSFEFYINEMPEGLTQRPAFKQPFLQRGDEKIDSVLSRLVYFDEFTNEEYTEYIEPLVSHLRFPLAGCLPAYPLLAELTNFVLSPGYLDRQNARKMLYDVGSSDWSRLDYIIKTWGHWEVYFQEISAYAPPNTPPEADTFPPTVPADTNIRIFREYLPLTDQPTEDPNLLFLPTKMMEQIDVNDYIILKLDRGSSASFKESLIQFILDHAGLDLHIDELMWEVNNADNYVLQSYMEAHATFQDMSSTHLGDSYRTLQALRQKGVRAHAWN
jgi:hypothetical protein